MSIQNVAVVILNYNSEDDLFKCITDLQMQHKINLITIVVDNASRPTTIEAVKEWSNQNFPDAISGTPKQVLDFLTETKVLCNTFFIYNNENNGYSAGNNVGIKLADKLDVDAVLIANPDMQFTDDTYIYTLAQELMSKDEYFITASKIVGLDGKDQSPLRESTFLEELLWPRQLFPRVFKKNSYIVPYDSSKIIEVPKVTGCSLLLKMSFLRDIGYLDENVFLYSEEAILSAQVKKYNGKIMFIPNVEAIHAHVRSKKANSSLRMLDFIKSRKYYIQEYSEYNKLQKFLLSISYGLLSLLHKIKSKGKN